MPAAPTPTRRVQLRYVLRNGRHGTLACLATSTSAAVLQALDLFGADLRMCAARCLPNV